MVALPQSFQASPRRGASRYRAGVTIGLACLMFAGDWLHAEPVAATTPEQAPSATAGPWPTNLEISQAPTATKPETAQRPDHDSIGQDRKAVTPRNAPAATPGIQDNETWQREFSSVIKEAVRPAYQDIADSGFVEAIRSMESDLGLSNKRPFGAELGADAENSRSEPHRESAGWTTPGNNAATSSRPRSAEEITRDQIMAKVMLKELVEEVKPWVFTLVGLYALGYSVKLLLDYRRWKMARRRKRTSSGQRRRHHGHSGHHSISQTLDSDPASARTAPASVAKN